ncbi:MAG: class I SAM-dependent methyltransferase [Chitinophagales bacterium]
MSFRWKIAQWFELRWWQNYLAGKNPAQYRQWKTEWWQKNVLQHVRVNAADTIADLGCGPAGIFMALPNNPITAVDPLLNNYIANQFLKPTDFPNVQFVNQRLEDFNAPEKFDLVFCLNCINHVTDIEKCFDVLLNCCKPGGRVIVSIDAHNHSFFKHLFRLIPGDILHPHQYNLNEYRTFLEKRNLSITAQHTIKEEFFFNHILLIAEKKSLH